MNTRALFCALIASACAFAQSIPVTGTLTLTSTGSIDAASGTLKFPDITYASLPTASSNSGKVYRVTDGSSSACTAGGGSTKCYVSSNGTSWVLFGGTGSGTPAGSSGQVQINDASAFGGRTLSGFTDNGTSLVPDGTVLGELGGNNTWTGHNYFPASTTQSLTAVGNSITCDRVTVAVSPTSSLTLTSAPTIADGTNGQLCTIVNVGSNSVILQDQDTLASSNLQLSAASITIPAKGQLTLQYNSTIGEWIQYTGVGGGSTSPLTTKGDLYTYSTTGARLGVGSDGQALVADSTQTTGIKWAVPLEVRPIWLAITSGNATSVLGGAVDTFGFGAGFTSLGSVGTPTNTTLSAPAYGFAAGDTGTSWGLFRTPGRSLISSSTANISNMDVKLYFHKTGAWNGTAKFRVEAACVNLDTGVLASAVSYTTPSFTSVTGSTTLVRQLVTFSNVLSGLTCGSNQDVYLKIYRGQTTADSDSETGRIDMTGGFIEITR